jgi:hypothetical protein
MSHNTNGILLNHSINGVDCQYYKDIRKGLSMMCFETSIDYYWHEVWICNVIVEPSSAYRLFSYTDNAFLEPYLRNMVIGFPQEKVCFQYKQDLDDQLFHHLSRFDRDQAQLKHMKRIIKLEEIQ